MAECMEYLHEKEIMHRDLKSLNVMVMKGKPLSTTRVVVLDFGVGRRIDEVSNHYFHFQDSAVLNLYRFLLVSQPIIGHSCWRRLPFNHWSRHVPMDGSWDYTQRGLWLEMWCLQVIVTASYHYKRSVSILIMCYIKLFMPFLQHLIIINGVLAYLAYATLYYLCRSCSFALVVWEVLTKRVPFDHYTNLQTAIAVRTLEFGLTSLFSFCFTLRRFHLPPPLSSTPPALPLSFSFSICCHSCNPYLTYGGLRHWQIRCQRKMPVLPFLSGFPLILTNFCGAVGRMILLDAQVIHQPVCVREICALWVRILIMNQ